MLLSRPFSNLYVGRKEMGPSARPWKMLPRAISRLHWSPVSRSACCRAAICRQVQVTDTPMQMKPQAQVQASSGKKEQPNVTVHAQSNVASLPTAPSHLLQHKVVQLLVDRVLRV